MKAHPGAKNFITPILLQTSPIEDITADVVHTWTDVHSMMTHCISGWRMAFRTFQDKKPDYLVLRNMAFTLRNVFWVSGKYSNSIDRQRHVCSTGILFHWRPITFCLRSTSHLLWLTAVQLTFIETPYMYKETIDMMVQMPKMKRLYSWWTHHN